MMSRDRVRFTLPVMRLTSSAESQNYRQLVKDVFGENIMPDDGVYRDFTIICRPSQFARFLIERNTRGLQNQFAELKPELFLVDDDRPRRVFDVSRNPSTIANIHYSKAKRDDA